jgi:hypothetical protein
MDISAETTYTVSEIHGRTLICAFFLCE